MLGIPWCPPELREQPFDGEPPALVEVADIRGDLHCHTTWSDGRASVEEMGRAARAARLRLPGDLRPHACRRRGARAHPDDVRRQAEEIAAANEVLAPFRILRGIECDILADGRLDLPDDVLAELDWVQASVHGGQRMPAPEMTRRVEEALRNPYVRCLSHPTGRYINRRPENALDLERIFEVALEQGVAVEVNGLAPRLDLSGEHVRDALRAGVEIVCSTDAHSVAGLENMTLAVATARRGWATAADVVNTRPLEAILARRRNRAERAHPRRAPRVTQPPARRPPTCSAASGSPGHTPVFSACWSGARGPATNTKCSIESITFSGLLGGLDLELRSGLAEVARPAGPGLSCAMSTSGVVAARNANRPEPHDSQSLGEVVR